MIKRLLILGVSAVALVLLVGITTKQYLVKYSPDETKDAYALDASDSTDSQDADGEDVVIPKEDDLSADEIKQIDQDTFLISLFVQDNAQIGGYLVVAGDIYSGGIKIIDSGKIPALTSDYFLDLAGGSITGVNAEHLNHVPASGFLRSDVGDTAHGVLTLISTPGSNDVSGGPIYINPPSSAYNYTLLGIAVDGTVKFKVDAEGDIQVEGTTTFGNIAYTWPSSQTANGLLQTNGTGTLNWATIGSSGITPDSLDFTEFVDDMTLDATTTIDLATNSADLNIGDGTLFIDNGGNVGIGTASPAYNAHIYGDINNAVALNLENANAGTNAFTQISSGAGSAGYWIYAFSQNYTESGIFRPSTVLFESNSGANLALHSKGGPLELWTSNSERLRIDSSGNVGIGTTAPGYKLEVAGEIHGLETLSAGGTTGNNGILPLANQVGSVNVYLTSGVGQNSYITGNLGIGTTAPTFGKLQLADALSGTNEEQPWTNTLLGLKNTDTTDNNVQSILFTTHDTNSAEISAGAISVKATDHGPNAVNTNMYFGTTKDSTYSTKMIIDSSGNVGIGTTAPSSLLHVNGSMQVSTTDGIDFNPGSDVDVDLITVGVTGTPSLTWYEDGGVIASKNSGLGAISAGSASVNIYSDWNDNGTNDGIIRFWEDGLPGSATQTAHLTYDGSADILTLSHGADYKKHLNIDSSGNVGIGTTAPGAKLQIDTGATGTIGQIIKGYSGQTANLQEWQNSSGANLSVLTSNGNLGLGTKTLTPAGPLHLLRSVGSTEMFISTYATNDSSSGRISFEKSASDTVGTKAETADDEILGKIGFWGVNTSSDFRQGAKIEAEQDGAAATRIPMRIVWSTESSTSGITERMRLDSTGNLGIGTTDPGLALDVVGSARFSAVGSGTYNADLNITSDGTLTTASSDISLKENLEAIEDPLAKVMRLNAYSFNWIEGGKADVGLVAQEVAEIIPEITFTNPVDGLMGINYSRLPAVLVGAIQEQQRLITNSQFSIFNNADEIANLRVSIINNAGNGLVLNPDGDILGTAQAEPEPEVEEEIIESVWEQLAGVLQLDKVLTFFKDTVFKARAIFEQRADFQQGIAVEGVITVDESTTGTLVIPTEAISVTATFPVDFETPPLVQLTPLTPIIDSYWVESVTTTSFVLKFAQPQTEEVRFQWLALVSSDDQTLDVNVDETDSAEAAIQEVAGAEAIPSPTTVPEEEVVDLSGYTVQVLNGTGVTGEAAAVAAEIESVGFVRVDADNAQTEDFTQTLVELKGDVPAEVIEIIESVISDREVVFVDDSLDDDGDYDVVITIGLSAIVRAE